MKSVGEEVEDIVVFIVVVVEEAVDGSDEIEQELTLISYPIWRQVYWQREQSPIVSSS